MSLLPKAARRFFLFRHRSGHHAQQSAKPHKAISSAISKFKAKAGSAKKSAKPLAEAVIPLDDDQRFSDF